MSSSGPPPIESNDNAETRTFEEGRSTAANETMPESESADGPARASHGSNTDPTGPGIAIDDAWIAGLLAQQATGARSVYTIAQHPVNDDLLAQLLPLRPKEKESNEIGPSPPLEARNSIDVEPETAPQKTRDAMTEIADVPPKESAGETSDRMSSAPKATAEAEPAEAGAVDQSFIDDLLAGNAAESAPAESVVDAVPMDQSSIESLLAGFSPDSLSESTPEASPVATNEPESVAEAEPAEADAVDQSFIDDLLAGNAEESAPAEPVVDAVPMDQSSIESLLAESSPEADEKDRPEGLQETVDVGESATGVESAIPEGERPVPDRSREPNVRPEAVSEMALTESGSLDPEMIERLLNEQTSEASGAVDPAIIEGLLKKTREEPARPSDSALDSIASVEDSLEGLLSKEPVAAELSSPPASRPPSRTGEPKIDFGALRRAKSMDSAQVKAAVGRIFGEKDEPDSQGEISVSVSEPASAEEEPSEEIPSRSDRIPALFSEKFSTLWLKVESGTAWYRAQSPEVLEIFGWVGVFLGVNGVLVLLLALLGWI